MDFKVLIADSYNMYNDDVKLSFCYNIINYVTKQQDRRIRYLILTNQPQMLEVDTLTKLKAELIKKRARFLLDYKIIIDNRSYKIAASKREGSILCFTEKDLRTGLKTRTYIGSISDFIPTDEEYILRHLRSEIVSQLTLTRFGTANDNSKQDITAVIGLHADNDFSDSRLRVRRQFSEHSYGQNRSSFIVNRYSSRQDVVDRLLAVPSAKRSDINSTNSQYLWSCDRPDVIVKLWNQQPLLEYHHTITDCHVINSTRLLFLPHQVGDETVHPSISTLEIA